MTHDLVAFSIGVLGGSLIGAVAIMLWSSRTN
jgi:hypothetical protein